MLRASYKLTPALASAGASPHAPAPPAPGNHFRVSAPAALPVVDPEVSNLSTWLYRAFGVLLFIRLVLIDSLMNRVVNYSDEGGSVIEKIHPATYGMLALLVITLVTTRVTFIKREFQIVRQLLTLIGVIFGLVIYVQLQGRSVSIGYLLETYIAACLIAILALTMSHEHRHKLGCFLVGYVVLNALLSILEKVGSFRIMPYPWEEATFRPTALTNHPLHLGLLMSATAIYVFATRWSGWVKAAALVIIVIGTFASGARTGMIFTCTTAFIGLWMTKMPGPTAEGRFRLRALLVVGLIFGVPLLLMIASGAGFLERFEGGYVDENAQARVDVYKVFDWVTTEQILFGADLLMIRDMVFDRLGLLIESSVVVFIFQFGLIGAVVFAIAIFWTMYRVASGGDFRAYLAIIAFLGPALSNDTMSGKHHYVLLFLLLQIFFRRDVITQHGQSKGLKWDEMP